jgi:DNA-binding MarR family transcriptional regulator
VAAVPVHDGALVGIDVVHAIQIHRNVVTAELREVATAEAVDAAVLTEKAPGDLGAPFVDAEVRLAGDQRKCVGFDDPARRADLGADAAIATGAALVRVERDFEADGAAVAASGMLPGRVPICVSFHGSSSFRLVAPGFRQYAVIMGKRQHAVKSSERATERSPAGDAFSAFVISVLRLGGLLGAMGDRLARPAGQTSARWQVLAAVELEPATVAQVARALGLARQSVQRVADLLSREGLTAYSENPSDLRAELLRLTPRGRSTLTSIQDAQRIWADALGAEIGENQLHRGTELLARVMAAVSAREGELPEN